LVSLHADGILRLWTTDDGRCVLTSQPGMLPINSNSASIQKVSIQSLNAGNAQMAGVVVISNPDNKEVIMVNAFKMTILKKVAITLEGGIQGINFDIKSMDRNIIIIGMCTIFFYIFLREKQGYHTFPDERCRPIPKQLANDV
jgi:hypothetical protein